MKLTGENRNTREKTCPSATLSTRNPTWTDPGSNPGLRGGRSATNRLSDGTASRASYVSHLQEFQSCGLPLDSRVFQPLGESLHYYYYYYYAIATGLHTGESPGYPSVKLDMQDPRVQ
jgi:hypothetical protein